LRLFESSTHYWYSDVVVAAENYFDGEAENVHGKES
jgi:hypothetical protein